MEKPILFSGESVRAILDGRKTQTRRLKGLIDVNNYPGNLQGNSTLGPLGYRGMEVSDYNLKPTEKKEFRINPGLYHWFLGEQENKKEINPIPIKCPYGQVSDILWVRETWKAEELESGLDGIHYKCDDGFQPIQNTITASDAWFEQYYKGRDNWRPSIFMPRWASRITLQIKNIRAEKLQDIRWKDCLAEGIEEDSNYKAHIDKIGKMNSFYPKIIFKQIWDSINAKRGYSWDSNPFVWVIEFEKL